MCLVITGLEIKHKSSAQVTANTNTTEGSSQEELKTLEQQVVTFLQGRHIHVQPEDMSICPSLPARLEKFKPSFVVSFISKKGRNNSVIRAKN